MVKINGFLISVEPFSHICVREVMSRITMKLHLNVTREFITQFILKIHFTFHIICFKI